MTSPTSFKQFLESRNQLNEASKLTPKSTMHYKVHKYNTIKLRSGHTTTEVQVRPQYTLLVEWAFDDGESGIVLNCEVIDREGVMIGKGVPQMISIKFQKWISRVAEVDYK